MWSTDQHLARCIDPQLFSSQQLGFPRSNTKVSKNVSESKCQVDVTIHIVQVEPRRLEPGQSHAAARDRVAARGHRVHLRDRSEVRMALGDK